MPDLSHLDWPFFDDLHREFASDLAAWSQSAVGSIDHGDVDGSCRKLVRALGDAGWLKAVVPAAFGGLSTRLDVRTMCLAREIFSWHDSLLDFAFAMQGLGTASISLFGSDEQKAKYLPAVCAGRHIAAFALSEPDAGSDVNAMTTTATKDGPSHWRLNGTKTWISNGGIADHYVVFARTNEAPGTKGISAFIVDADTPGLSIERRIDVIAPHPLATIGFANCRVATESRLGAPGTGFKVAMATLDVFRPTVAAAAVGLARRGLDEAIDRSATRKMFGKVLADMQMTQASLAESAIEIDAAALLVYRAAWASDQGGAHATRAASSAKAFATEMAQRVIDRAVQIFGGQGVRVGNRVEALYREIRAMRIYEGATEVHKIIVARDLLKSREVGRLHAAE